ncbi:hypothetical protein BJP27_24130 (plasmid) [Pseudomonas oryzihabitans]|nr:hypothetical protein BJP27_24130 [Pseudomonas psychrotolerans]
MLHFGQNYRDAGAIPLSECDQLFESRAFEQWRKAQDGEIEIQLGLGKRLDAVIKGLGALGNALSR